MKPSRLVNVLLESLPSSFSRPNDVLDVLENVVEASLEPRRSKRLRVETRFGPDFITIIVIECGDDLDDESFISTFIIEDDTKIYDESIMSNHTQLGMFSM